MVSLLSWLRGPRNVNDTMAEARHRHATVRSGSV